MDDSSGRRHSVLTEFGRQLLTVSVSRYSELKDLILLLTESEHYGISMANHGSKESGPESLESESAELERFLKNEQLATIKEIARLNEAGNHLDALRGCLKSHLPPC